MVKLRPLFIIIILVCSIFPYIPAQAQPEWLIDGSKVYTDTQSAYISAEPHTLGSSGWVTFTVRPKQYSGPIDVIFGFTDDTKPTEIQYWGSGSATIYEKTLVPTESYNPFTQSTSTIYSYMHMPVEVQQMQWNTISPNFVKINKDYLGMSKWFYLSGRNVNAGQTYTFRIYIELQFSPEGTNGKYCFGIRRTGDTIEQAYILDPWYNASWDKRIALTVPDEYISDDLADFPILIDKTLAAFSTAQDDGDDFVFTNANGDKLPHEIELWNNETNKLVAWVCVQLTDGADNTFYIYWENAAAENQQNVEGTWNSDYKAVWHMGSSDGDEIDSTGNGYTMTGNGDPSEVSDGIGLGTYYDGNDYATRAAFVASDGAYATTEIYAYLSSETSAWRYALSKTWVEAIAMNTNFKAYAMFDDDVPYPGAASTSSFVQNTYAYVAGTHNTSAVDGIKIYWNGTLENSRSSQGNIDTGAVPWFLGTSNGGGDFWVGAIDEVRLSTVTRSAAWINTTYWTMARSDVFVVWGDVEAELVTTTVTSLTTTTATVSTTNCVTSTGVTESQSTVTAQTTITTTATGTSTTTVSSSIISIQVDRTVFVTQTISKDITTSTVSYTTTSITSKVSTTTQTASSTTTCDTSTGTAVSTSTATATGTETLTVGTSTVVQTTTGDFIATITQEETITHIVSKILTIAQTASTISYTTVSTSVNTGYTYSATSSSSTYITTTLYSTDFEASCVTSNVFTTETTCVTGDITLTEETTFTSEFTEYHSIHVIYSTSHVEVGYVINDVYIYVIKLFAGGGGIGVLLLISALALMTFGGYELSRRKIK